MVIHAIIPIIINIWICIQYLMNIICWYKMSWILETIPGTHHTSAKRYKTFEDILYHW